MSESDQISALIYKLKEQKRELSVFLSRLPDSSPGYYDMKNKIENSIAELDERLPKLEHMLRMLN